MRRQGNILTLRNLLQRPMKYFLILLFFLWGNESVLFSQNSEDIHLVNPSFEGTPRKGIHMFYLEGWRDCGAIHFPMESPPDVHPADAAWENDSPTFDGYTYLGMVVRDNDSWESVSQRLSGTIEAGKCYSFSIALMRSSQYVSPTRLNINSRENYQEPAVLRMWGGTGFCHQKELLAESEPITNRKWIEYHFEFKPKQSHVFFTLEAFYKTPVLFPYNGHILLDMASHIIRIPCDEDDILVEEEPLEEVAIETPKIIQSSPQKRQTPKVSSPTKNEEKAIQVSKNEPVLTIMSELKRDNLKKGQIITIKNLYFEADTSTINESSLPVLDEIFTFLTYNHDIVIEIGGHTNGIPEDDYCDKLSSARAKAVADFLVEKGIQPSKIQYKGYGKRYRIASDKTLYGRQKNQRVEIKILEFGASG